ncbi:retrovirus-related pol polyprotein from transposon TNT 1-94 [Tanacetum coccineum]
MTKKTPFYVLEQSPSRPGWRLDCSKSKSKFFYVIVVLGMETLSLVSKYLNDLEEYLDDGNSLEARKLTIGKSKKELEFNPFTRLSLPCDVDGQDAWDAELDMADSFNYMTEERFDKLGFVRVDYGKYGRKMVKEVRVEIHGFRFLVDFIVFRYANEGEPSVIFCRDFLVTSKRKVDFGIGEMRIDLTMLEEEKEFDAMLGGLVEKVEEVGSSNGELVKMRKASRNKGHNVNKLTPLPQLKIEEIPSISSIAPPPPIYHPLSQKQKEKKLDEAMMGHARLSSDEFGEEEKMRIVEHGLPNKMCDPGNFVLPDRVNGTIEMSALADTEASVSVLPYSLFKNLGLSDPKPYHFNLTITDNTQAKAMGEVRNVRIQIGYQAYLVDFLVLDIPMDKKLPLLLGRPFLRTCGAVIDIGGGTMSIDDGVIRHTYFPKPRAKTYLDNFELDEEDDWLSCFEVGRDKDGNPKYGPIAPSLLNIEDDMERALAMKAYFNLFKNIIGNEGYGVYKKIEGDGAWHAKFEVITPSGQKFTRGFKTKETRGSSSGNLLRKTYSSLIILLIRGSSIQTQNSTQSSHPNPLIENYEKQNKQGIVEYHVQQVKNANLKWKEFSSMERHAYCERLSKLQGKEFGTPRVADWTLFYSYNFDETLKNKMKFEYIHSDGDVLKDYSWERALSISGDVYPEWCLKFFSTMYFNKGVERTKLMIEKCIWFSLCGHEQVLTLPQFTVLLRLYEEDELKHHLFAIHFTKLEVDDKLFNHDAYWQQIGTPTSTNPRTSLIKEPLMRIVHRLLVGSLVHRVGSKERCQKRDLWLMSALDESRGIDLAWVIAEHLFKHAPGLKENSLICGGHYVTEIAKSLGYLADEEVSKCLEPIECGKWTAKMLASELDEDIHTLFQTTRVAPQPREARRQRQEQTRLNSSWGDWNASLNEIKHRDVWRDSMLMRNKYMLEHSVPILYHLADQSNFAYPTYEPPNVPLYPYPYVPYPHPYTHYPNTSNQSYGGEHYGAQGDAYYAGPIVPSSGYEIGGSSGGVHDDEDDMSD